MLSRHSLPQMIPPRVNGALQRMAQEIWYDYAPHAVEATEASPEQCTLLHAMEQKRVSVPAGSFWGRLFDQRWARVVFAQPTDANAWFEWRDQAEATLYVDGKPHFGFNVAHRRCPLPEGTTQVWLQCTCVQSAIWHPDAAQGMRPSGSLFEGAFTCRRDDALWEAYHDLKCLFDVFMDQRHRESPHIPETPAPFGLQPPLTSVDPVYRRMLALIEEALDARELHGVNAMRQKLADAYKALRYDKSFMNCVLTGHAHLDLVWIWPRRIGELKAVNIFATASNLMARYPEYRFAYSQPCSYEAVEQREPLLYKTVLKHMQLGQWQATGAMYVEADTTIPCGEALARCFEVGQEGFSRLNGHPSRVLWLPDVFGYSACLPQLMRLNGVDSFFTTKMTWNAVNRFPYSSFVWRGNDGSEVVSHVTQDSGYVTHTEVFAIKNPMRAHQQADVHHEFLLPTGYGDGGGGPTDDMCERARRLSNLPGMPAIVWDQPEAFFDRLRPLKESLPVHQGECYLEYHRGTFTTHGNLKATARHLEHALFCAEAVSAISGKSQSLDEAWKALIFSQFHDFIPGSSVWDVYLEDLPKMEKYSDDVNARAQALLGTGTEDCFFNPHAHTVRQWVSCHGKPYFVRLPALTGLSLVQAAQDAPLPVVVAEREVSNGECAFRLNEDGFIDHLVCQGREIPLSSPAGQLMLYPDKAGNFEAWDIDRHVLSLGVPCCEPAQIESFDENGIRAGLRVHRRLGAHSEATITFSLEAGSPLLHITVELNWHEPESLLKLLIPTQFAASHARFGAPFGSVLRPQQASGLRAEAMWEVPFSRHLEVFDEGEQTGLMLLSEDKYGATVRDGVIGVSLVRSPRVTGYDHHANAWPPHLTRLNVPSPYSDMGVHTIRLAIGSYDIRAPRERQPAALAETVFTELIPYCGDALPSPLQELCGGETLVPAWSKPLSDGAWLLRLHETAGQRGECVVRAAQGWHVGVSDFLGNTTVGTQTECVCAFTPYQIKTIRFERSL